MALAAALSKCTQSIIFSKEHLRDNCSIKHQSKLGNWPLVSNQFPFREQQQVLEKFSKWLYVSSLLVNGDWFISVCIFYQDKRTPRTYWMAFLSISFVWPSQSIFSPGGKPWDAIFFHILASYLKEKEL